MAHPISRVTAHLLVGVSLVRTLRRYFSVLCEDSSLTDPQATGRCLRKPKGLLKTPLGLEGNISETLPRR